MYDNGNNRRAQIAAMRQLYRRRSMRVTMLGVALLGLVWTLVFAGSVFLAAITTVGLYDLGRWML